MVKIKVIAIIWADEKIEETIPHSQFTLADWHFNGNDIEDVPDVFYTDELAHEVFEEICDIPKKIRVSNAEAKGT